MGVEADRFAHEVLRHAEMLGKLPQLRVPFGDGVVKVVLRDELADRPFIGAVLMALPLIDLRIAAVKAARLAMPDLMAELRPLLRLGHAPTVDANDA